jgi:acyl carrier protein
MSETQVNLQLNQILQGFNRYGEQISDQTKLEDDLGLDSLGLLILIAEIESTFGITVDSDMERTRKNFGTVAQLRSFVTQKIESKTSAI